jgi:hypothetical protein
MQSKPDAVKNALGNTKSVYEPDYESGCEAECQHDEQAFYGCPHTGNVVRNELRRVPALFGLVRIRQGQSPSFGS